MERGYSRRVRRRARSWRRSRAARISAQALSSSGGATHAGAAKRVSSPRSWRRRFRLEFRRQHRRRRIVAVELNAATVRMGARASAGLQSKTPPWPRSSGTNGGGSYSGRASFARCIPQPREDCSCRWSSSRLRFRKLRSRPAHANQLLPDHGNARCGGGRRPTSTVKQEIVLKHTSLTNKRP